MSATTKFVLWAEHLHRTNKHDKLHWHRFSKSRFRRVISKSLESSHAFPRPTHLRRRINILVSLFGCSRQAQDALCPSRTFAGLHDRNLNICSSFIITAGVSHCPARSSARSARPGCRPTCPVRRAGTSACSPAPRLPPRPSSRARSQGGRRLGTRSCRSG